MTPTTVPRANPNNQHLLLLSMHIGEPHADDSITSKDDHHSSTIFPEQLMLSQSYWRPKKVIIKRSGYAKDATLAIRRNICSSGYNDYLWTQSMQCITDICFNGGRRAYS